MERHSVIWHPFTQHALMPRALHVNSAKDAYLYVHEDVRKQGDGAQCKIIDAISSWWVITHGHCHPHIIKCVQEQSEKLEQVIFAGFTHDQAEQLATRMVELTARSFRQGYDHVFFSDSGSTSVEVALKMAIGYWTHTGKTRRKIVALENGYHGDTFGAMSAGGRCQFNALYDPYLFDVAHIPVPEAVCEGESLQRLEDYLLTNKGDVAAFIFEPLVQGAGGMRVYSPQALADMAKLCRAHDVLLIADEVMTGFGRTGTMFACEQAGIMPDIMCLSKGVTAGFLPMGLTLCTHDIYKAFYHKDRGKMFFHSSSFTGNALACAAANASLDIWEREPVLQRIADISKAHTSAAQEFSQQRGVANIRQIGTILALDVVGDEDQQEGYLSDLQPRLYAMALERGVLLRPLGNSLYVLPPYCVSQDDLACIYGAMREMIAGVL
ncbi:MAG: adenosylmethionine--8-amino-7-oxononanoate transaminase [Alphaproteobacteria bacterium]